MDQEYLPMEVPTSIAVGVARPNAQGHETTCIEANTDVRGIHDHCKFKELRILVVLKQTQKPGHNGGSRDSTSLSQCIS